MREEHNMHIALIVAMDEKNAIGRDGDLLCHLPNDLKHFQQITSGHIVMMGRKTYESLPRGALPNRTNIVITSRDPENYPGCLVAQSVEEAFTHCGEDEKVFVIGGGMLYRTTLSLADHLYITRIHHTFSDADTFFPEINPEEWKLIEKEPHEADGKHPCAYTFLTYTKNLHSITGEKAWKRFLAGDDKSFETFYHAYFPELFAYALKLGFDVETCKDAIQDVFFNIYTAKSKLRHIQNIEFYLLRSLKNRLFDIYQNEHKLTEINYQEIFTGDDETIVEQIIDRENQAQLAKNITLLLQTLPPKQRKIIHFHYQLNLSYTEIGEILHISPDAVKKTMYRALKKLRTSSPNNPLLLLAHLFTLFG